MDELFPDYLKDYLREDKIDLEDYSLQGAGIILPNGVMFINKKDHLEEQVMTVLHEVLHLHPEFIAYTGGIWKKTMQRDEAVERMIEDLARKVYDKMPDVVDLVRKTIVDAKKHPLNF